MNALHAIAPSGNWIECRRSVHSAFHEYSENASITLLPQILTKIPVLIFAGDQDLICNYVGLEAMIKEMTWNGAKGLGVGDSFGIVHFTYHVLTIDCRNAIVGREQRPGGNVGFLKKSDLCQSKFILFHKNMRISAGLTHTYTLSDLQRLTYGTLRCPPCHA